MTIDATTIAADTAVLVTHAKLYAALSGPFEPIAALHAAGAEEPNLATLVASALATACDTDLDSGTRWLLRSGERRYILDTLARDPAALATAIADRRAQTPDPASADLLAALAGDGDMADTAISATLNTPVPDRATVERIVSALDRAGPSAPAAARLVDARTALAGLDRRDRRSAFDARGFFGRTSETAALVAWLEKPLTAPPARAAYISGNPGIGKSALLEEVTSQSGDQVSGIVIRLDFDRAGLDVNDLLGLTMEVARQVADRLGENGKPLYLARLTAASVTRGEESYGGSSRSNVPADLLAAIGLAVRSAGRPVLLILDTIEVLRARGEEHPERLFRWIDMLLQGGLVPLSVVAAGRGDALGSADLKAQGRVGLSIALAGLDPSAAAGLVDRLGVPVDACDAVTTLADGNPLVLRLAATVVERYGATELPQGIMDKDVAAAFLYRILLSRIDDPELKQLANPGLIARRISADFLAQVLAPALKMPPLTPARAETLFNALAGQLWLVERDPSSLDFVQHRTDMRAILLPLLYQDQAALCATVDAAAAAWFGQRADAASQLDAAYHRLQLLRVHPAVPVISAAVAQRFDAAMLAELPPQARDVVTLAAGGRSSKLRQRATPPSPADEAAMASDVLNMIDREDWAEGQFVVDQMATNQALDPRSPAALAIRAFYWRAGRWQRARRLFAERDRMVSNDSAIFTMPLQLAISRFEIRSEFTRPRLVRMFALPGIDTVIANALRSAGPLARQGAFAFVLAAHGRRQDPIWSAKDGDAVAAALDIWAGASDAPRGAAPATAHAFGVVRERLGARGLVSAAAIDWNDVQLLAALSPYPIIAANLAVLRADGKLVEAARGADARLAWAGGLFSGSPIGLGPLATNPIAGVAGLGLFAEWAGAQAFLSRDDDLGSIASAAERWRQTIAGNWGYGDPPPGWAASDGPDHVIARRVRKLAAFDDPADWAMRELTLWAPDGDGAKLLATIRKRLAKPIAAAVIAADPIARAGILLASNVPSAFVPALAILIAPEGTPK